MCVCMYTCVCLCCIYVFVNLCVYVHVYVTLNLVACRNHKRETEGTLMLVLQTAESGLTWVLEIELRSSGRSVIFFFINI